MHQSAYLHWSALNVQFEVVQKKNGVEMQEILHETLILQLLMLGAKSSSFKRRCNTNYWKQKTKKRGGYKCKIYSFSHDFLVFHLKVQQTSHPTGPTHCTQGTLNSVRVDIMIWIYESNSSMILVNKSLVQSTTVDTWLLRDN